MVLVENKDIIYRLSSLMLLLLLDVFNEDKGVNAMELDLMRTQKVFPPESDDETFSVRLERVFYYRRRRRM
jgi:hypothetical protein